MADEQFLADAAFNVPDRAHVNKGNIATDRGNQVKRDDKQKNYYLGLYDIDECIQYYFDNVIRPTVDDGDEFVKVPMIYGSPERWNSIQAHGSLRDKQGKLQIPAIVYRRTSVAKNRNLSNKLDANKPLFHYTFQKQYNPRNRYDNFSVMNDIQPSTENYNIVIPDFVTLTYECIIWTEYVEQMNKIVESINYAEDAYWGDAEKFKFRALVEDFSSETELEADADRTVRTSFTISMEGYIIPDAMNKELAQQNVKTFGPTQTVFRTKAVVERDGQLVEIEESPPTVVPVVVEYENKYALLFDGVDDFLDVGNHSSIRPTDELTCAVWAKTDAACAASSGKVSTFFGCVAVGGWDLAIQTNYNNTATQIQSRIRISDTGAGSPGYLSANDSQVNSTVLRSGDWMHVAMTYSKITGTSKIFLNGIFVGSAQGTAGADITYHVTTPQLFFGADHGNPSSAESPFTGNLDEGALWNKALSPAEILQIYNNNKPFDLTSNLIDYVSSAQLRGYWRMGDPDGAWSYPTITDASDGTNNGTMTNMTSDAIVLR